MTTEEERQLRDEFAGRIAAAIAVSPIGIVDGSPPATLAGQIASRAYAMAGALIEARRGVIRGDELEAAQARARVEALPAIVHRLVDELRRMELILFVSETINDQAHVYGGPKEAIAAVSASRVHMYTNEMRYLGWVKIEPGLGDDAISGRSLTDLGREMLAPIADRVLA